MAIPSTGTTWRAGGFNDVDSRFNARGGLAAILIRNNRGAATNISPWTAGSPPTVGWSPFAEDGTPRDDLFAVIRVDGEWITNPDANEGFWLIGALTEDGGPERAPNINEDNQMILQSNFPFDTDLTEEGLVINFTGVETLKPLMKRLRMNQPLSDSSGNPIVEDPGTENFSIGKPIDVESQEWQIILIFARRKGGRYLYSAEGYSLCKLTNIGNFRRSKTDPDAGELGYTVLPDPYFVSKDPANPDSDELVPVLYVEWVAGEGWTAIGGVPVWPGSAPVGTQTGATTATVSAADPEGAGDPFTVTAEKAAGPGFSSWSSATIGSVTEDTPGAGFTTYNITGLTTATDYKVRLTATGTNGQSAVSAVSNSFTTA
jgi:hypothetical protein